VLSLPPLLKAEGKEALPVPARSVGKVFVCPVAGMVAANEYPALPEHELLSSHMSIMTLVAHAGCVPTLQLQLQLALPGVSVEYKRFSSVG
jgi:hypothetical protein